MAENVNLVMMSIPEQWRTHWCGGEYGPCACMGCVQVGNRLIMTGRTASMCDPEYIDESKIPEDIYKKYKVTREEWEEWMNNERRHYVCDQA